MPFSAPLTNRSALLIEGVDSVAFLQNLVSNDVRLARADSAVHAALLTPQGKFLHDLFVTAAPEGLLLDIEAERRDDLIARLNAYKLRAKIALRPMDDAYDLWAVWGTDAPPVGYADPRLPALGRRVFVAKGETPPATEIQPFAAYDEHRLTLGIADGSRDLELGQSTLAEGNFDLLNGIDWEKGCYIGQELTARMHYRGLAKKRLFPVRLSALLPSGAVITGQGREVGTMRSSNGARGLALLDITAAQQAVAEKAGFHCNSTEILPFWPAWMPQKG